MEDSSSVFVVSDIKMIEKIKTEKKADYLLITLSDVVITAERAHEILEFIGQESEKSNCCKILLDERTVESREVSNMKIVNLSADFEKDTLQNIRIAFICQPKLINKDAELLTVCTYKNEYVIQHFAEMDKGLEWLLVER